MSYNYSNDPGNNDKDLYRFLIGDTGYSRYEGDATYDSTPTYDFILHDEEIEYILDTYTSKNMRLYQLYYALANRLSRDIKQKLGPQEIDPTERIKNYQTKAENYRRLVCMSGLSIPGYLTDGKQFTIGIHDNPDATYDSDSEDGE